MSLASTNKRRTAETGESAAGARSTRHSFSHSDSYSRTVIVRQGATNGAAYLILAGRAVVGRDEQAATRSLAVLQAGDFFAEIAALAGVRRTANVVAKQPTMVPQVPAATLRRLINSPRAHELFVRTLTERLVQLNMADLPRFAGLDHGPLRELRTPDPHPTSAADFASQP